MGQKRSQFNKSGVKNLISGRNSQKGFTHIKDIINNIIVTSALPIDFDNIRIWDIWDSVVGERISMHAQPSKIKKGVLTVKVTDSVWTQELKFEAEGIRKRLNLGLKNEAVSKIKFRVGEPANDKLKISN